MTGDDEPDLHTEAATMRDALKMFATMPRALYEWTLLVVRYPDEAERLDSAFHELDDAHGKLTQLEMTRILANRMRHSVKDPFTGRAVPGPHHPAPGEHL